MAGDQGTSRPFSPLPHRLAVKRTTGSHRVLERSDWPDVVFAFHDSQQIGPRMLARIDRQTGLKPDDL